MKWMRGNSKRREELKRRRKRRKSVKAKNSRIIVFPRLLTYLENTCIINAEKKVQFQPRGLQLKKSSYSCSKNDFFI